MAKMIKCPTCGTQIEVPPQAAGQIVKCPGCGKGLKLVAKAKPGGPGAGAGQQAGGAGMTGSPGGSVSGSSVSAMTFVGETPPHERPGPALDDLPSLDSNCAVCGRPVDPEDLIEDNGRLVCLDCVKGARSGMARPEGGAELIDFKPAAGPVKRGKLINFTPTFFLGALAAVVFAVAWVCLEIGIVEKPVGTQTALARPTPGGKNTAAAVTPFDPETNPQPATPTNDTSTAPAMPASPDDTTATTGATPTAPTDATAAAPTTPDTSATPDPNSPTTAPPPADGTAPSTNTAVALAPNPDAETIFNDSPTAPAKDGGAAQPGDAGAAAPPGDPAVPPADLPAPAPSVVSTDPLERGFERLTARDYSKAAADLDTARLRHVVGKLPPVGMALTAQQQMTLEGLAACYIGMGRVDAARGSLESAYSRNVRSRSLILNTAIYMIAGARQLNSMVQAADMVRQHMSHQQNDEYAADIFGTLVNKISAMPNAPKEKIDAWWTFHDNYIDQLAARGDVAPEGKLKWGIDWLPADEVKTYRTVRGMTNANAGVGAAAKEVELAAQRKRSAERTLAKATADRAKGDTADVTGAEAQVDAANAALEKAQLALKNANDAVDAKKPRWLTKFEPVIPQPVVAP